MIGKKTYITHFFLTLRPLCSVSILPWTKARYSAKKFNIRSMPTTLMASSASMLQCSLTGGRLSSLAISEFLISPAALKLFPYVKDKVNKQKKSIYFPPPFLQDTFPHKNVVGNIALDLSQIIDICGCREWEWQLSSDSSSSMLAAATGV